VVGAEVVGRARVVAISSPPPAAGYLYEAAV